MAKYTKMKTMDYDVNTEKGAVFVIPYIKNKIYEKYPVSKSLSEKKRTTEFVSMLQMTRAWQGSVGWIGGMVDEGETILQALVREVKEETENDLDLSKVKPLCRHQNQKGFNIVCYSVELDSVEQAKEWISNTTKAEHFGSESGGLGLVTIQHCSVDSLDKTNWCATAGVEAKLLLEQLGVDLDNLL